jgi:hypothetical protein
MPELGAMELPGQLAAPDAMSELLSHVMNA